MISNQQANSQNTIQIKISQFAASPIYQKLAPSFKVTARTADGMIEAVEGDNLPSWYLGVQWHPELMFQTDPESEQLFQALVDESKNYGKIRR